MPLWSARPSALSLLIAVLLFRFTRRELLALSATYERHLRAEAAQQEELKESREWFQITLKSLGEAVVATDQSGTISFINPVAQQLTGWNLPPRLNGRPFHDVMRLRGRAHPTGGGRPRRTLVRRAQKVVSFSNGLMLTGRNEQGIPD